jgi:hypothetical protein
VRRESPKAARADIPALGAFGQDRVAGALLRPHLGVATRRALASEG